MNAASRRQWVDFLVACEKVNADAWALACAYMRDASALGPLLDCLRSAGQDELADRIEQVGPVLWSRGPLDGRYEATPLGDWWEVTYDGILRRGDACRQALRDRSSCNRRVLLRWSEPVPASDYGDTDLRVTILAYTARGAWTERSAVLHASVTLHRTVGGAWMRYYVDGCGYLVAHPNRPRADVFTGTEVVRTAYEIVEQEVRRRALGHASDGAPMAYEEDAMVPELPGWALEEPGERLRHEFWQGMPRSPLGVTDDGRLMWHWHDISDVANRVAYPDDVAIVHAEPPLGDFGVFATLSPTGWVYTPVSWYIPGLTLRLAYLWSGDETDELPDAFVSGQSGEVYVRHAQRFWRCGNVTALYGIQD